MPLDFPNSPVDGQIYENYVWNATDSVWQGLANQVVTALISNTPTGSYTSGGVDYEYVTFTSSGTLNVTRGGLCDVLVVGGGGSGGTQLVAANVNCGGGGAGGLIQISNFYITPGAQTITVGAGGLANEPGGDSAIGAQVIAAGGARGGSNDYAGRNKGGSGGGGSCSADIAKYSPGVGMFSQGNAGGSAHTGVSNNGGGGGGGGASAVGGTGTLSPSVGGAGGAGIASSITGTSVTYAGGGGGACLGGTAGAGGAGGGGKGQDSTAAVSGTANTGGGGGGAQSTNTPGAGGSGVVIVRWRA